MLRITRRDVEDAFRYADRSLASARDPDMGNVPQRATRTLGVLAGAGLNGFLSGRFGNLKMGPVPVDLVAALVGHGAGLMGLAGKWDDHLHAISDGILASYMTKVSVGWGTQVRAQAGLPPIVVGSYKDIIGDSNNPLPNHGNMPYGTLAGPPPNMAAPLTEAELAAMADPNRNR